MRGGESGSEKKKIELVPKEVCDKQNMERRSLKCGRSNHQVRDGKAHLRAKTPLFPSNGNQKPVDKKSKFDKEYLKITELGSEEDLGKA